MELLEGFRHLFAQRNLGQVFIDLIDVLVVAYVIYRALLVVRGTRAMQMGTGLLVIFALYISAKWAGLVTLFSMLSSLLSSLVLVVVVVFQNDIRRGLMRVGARAFLGGNARGREVRVIDEVVAAANELARHRMGALICFEQEANLDEFVVNQGTVVDAAVHRDLLVSIFVPESVNKLQDGAVIIRNYRIAKAGVFFPMPDGKVQDRALGTRHRAALGISEETDAVVIIVSEERGTISFCFNGNIVSGLDGPSLKDALIGLSSQASPVSRRPERRADVRSTRDTPTTPLGTLGGTPAVTHAGPVSTNMRAPSNPPPPLSPGLAQGLATFRSTMPPPPPVPLSDESMSMMEKADASGRPRSQTSESPHLLKRADESDPELDSGDDHDAKEDDA